jgi:polysaccharide biosynthesis transport protein
MDGSQVETPQGSMSEGMPAAIDIHQLIAAFRRRLRLIAGVALIVLTAAVIYTFQQTPRYTATANVMLDTRQQQVVDVNAVMSGLPADSASVDSEVQVLKSRSLAEKVVIEQKLEEDSEFNPALAEPGPLQQLLKFGRSAAPVRAGPADPVMQRRQHEAVVDRVLGRLSVRRAGLTYLIDVSFTSEDPVKAAKIANAFASRYLVEQLDAKFDATQQANVWLNTKVGEIRQQVVAAETAVQQYRIANNLMSSQGATLTEQQISTLDQQVAMTRAQQAEADARVSTARRQLAQGSTGEDVGEALSSPVVQQLRRQRAEVSTRVADLEGRYGERHPDLLKAKREMTDLDSQIQAEIGRIISNLEAQAQVARQRTASIAGSAGSAKGELAANNRASIRLNELERNAEAARALYESFLGRFKETSAQQGLETSDARVISQAKVPNGPSYPNKGLNLMLGVALALGAGLGAAVLAEALDSGLSTADDVERHLDLPYLGAIPSLASTLEDAKAIAANGKTAPVDYVVQRPLSSFSEAFRNLRASVMFSRVGETVKVIAITSSLPGEGKTTTSIALARTMGIAGASAVVVDCDLRQRGVNRILADEPVNGLLEVLNGAVTLDQALVRDEASGIMILPLAKSAYTPKDVFGTPAMRRLLAELRQRFDVVVLDTAPVLPIADTRVLAPLADTVVLLTRWRKTPRKAAEASLRLLHSVNAHVAGAALTQVDLKAQAKYGYGDPGYYYKSYKKYYTG